MVVQNHFVEIAAFIFCIRFTLIQILFTRAQIPLRQQLKNSQQQQQQQIRGEVARVEKGNKVNLWIDSVESEKSAYSNNRSTEHENYNSDLLLVVIFLLLFLCIMLKIYTNTHAHTHVLLK